MTIDPTGSAPPQPFHPLANSIGTERLRTPITRGQMPLSAPTERCADRGVRAGFAIVLATLATPVAAQEVAVGHDTYAVVLRRTDLHPTTPKAARRAAARIEKAAMAVCGASPGSLIVVKRAVRRSACWRETLADVYRRIDEPLLPYALSGDHR